MRAFVSRAFLMALLLGAATSAYAIPQLVNYQGTLTDAGGVPITVATTVEFRIWDSPSGGSELWMESQSVTPNGSGSFNVLLGSATPIPSSAFAADAFLGIKVSPDPEMTPRAQLVSVGYAYRTGSVNGASGGTITGKVSIGPGHTNTGDDAFVAGSSNTVGGNSATIGGGSGNTANANFGTIGGGSDNQSSFGAFVGGGANNTAGGIYSTVAGGNANTAGATQASVGGGQLNEASGLNATVSGGIGNLASNQYSTVGGGNNNDATGIYSCVPGGFQNAARGQGSFAAGNLGKANHDGSIVISATSSTDPADSVWTTRPGQMVIRANGLVVLSDTVAGYAHWLDTSLVQYHKIFVEGGARCTGPDWVNFSSESGKENFAEVDGADLLERLASLPITRWNYKDMRRNVQHIGPMAEDFYAAFRVGWDDNSISTIDPAGIALAAIQELDKRTRRIDKLENEIAELREIVRTLSQK